MPCHRYFCNKLHCQLAIKCCCKWYIQKSFINDELGIRGKRHSFWLDGAKSIKDKNHKAKGLVSTRVLSILFVRGVADEAAVGTDFIKTSHLLLQQEPLYILWSNLLERGIRVSLGEIVRKLGFLFNSSFLPKFKEFIPRFYQNSRIYSSDVAEINRR